MKRYCSVLIGVVCFLAMPVLALRGGAATNTVQNGAWSSVSTWDNGVPTLGGHQATVRHVVGVTTAAQGAVSIILGTVAGPGTVNLSAGSLTTGSNIDFGTGGNTGTLNLSGGTLTSNTFRIGWGGPGVFNMTGGSLVVGSVTMPQDAPGDSGSFTLSGGTMTLSGTMTIGAAANSSPGTLAIEGGAGSFTGTNGGIDGTVHFTSESTLVIRPDGPMPNTNLTRFDVGTVNIDTGATLEFDPQYSPQVGDNWFIFISQNLVGGTEMSANFTNVVVPAGFTISQNVAPTRGGGPEKMTVTVTAVPATWVDFGFLGPGDGSPSNPWGTLIEGLANVAVGGIIKIKGDTGSPTTPETPTIMQDVTLQAPSGTVTIGVAPRRSQSGFVSRKSKGK